MGPVFFPSYLIGLREGLEMVLIVSVLVAYLVKTGRRRHLLPVWGEVAAAALSYVSTTVLGGPGQELLDAITSVVAVVGIAVAAVVREGLGTALLSFASAQGATTATPLLELGTGLLTAVALGVALYGGAVRIDLTPFSTVSGVLLVLIAAGISEYAVQVQEAGVLPGLTTYAYDASPVLDPGSWYGAVLGGGSGSPAGSPAGAAGDIAVAAADDSCDVATSELEAGTHQ